MYESQEPTIYSQIESQREMPIAKKSRKGPGGYRSSKKNKTTYVKRVWPLASNRLQIHDPFPAKMRSRLRYSEVVTLLPTTGVPAPYIFRANGIFDPNQSGVGHQPYGHDTLASIYNHYQVVSSIITMTPTDMGNSQIFGISLTDDTTVQSDYDTIRETKGTRMATCPSNSALVPSVTHQYAQNSNFKAGYADKACVASYGSSPAEQMFYHCWAEGENSTATSNSSSYLITITYIVDSFELRDLGQS